MKNASLEFPHYSNCFPYCPCVSGNQIRVAGGEASSESSSVPCPLIFIVSSLLLNVNEVSKHIGRAASLLPISL